jgi:hypothetical protein
MEVLQARAEHLTAVANCLTNIACFTTLHQIMLPPSNLLQRVCSIKTL